MIGDYKIIIQTHSTIPTGKYETTRIGTKRPISRDYTVYRTRAGEFEPDQWKVAALAEIERCEETDLLERVKQYVRKHCAWLHTKAEIEEYAIDCLCGRSYLHWEEWNEK